MNHPTPPLVRNTRRRVATRKSSGVTLIELMMVVGLIGIMASMAIGFSGTWRRRQDQRELSREAFNALTLARATALQRGVTTKVEFDDDAEHIYAFIEAMSGDCEYTGELLVYNYPGGNIENWFGVSDIYDNDMSLTLSSTAESGGMHTIIFDHRGFSRAQNGDPRGAVLTLTDARSGESILIDVSIAGALRIRL